MKTRISLNPRRNKKVWPYYVQCDVRGKEVLRYFKSNTDAALWVDFVNELNAATIPVGVVIDLRSSTRPFLARRRTMRGSRARKYCATLEEAMEWLKDLSTT
jgi:hypothetical protein